MEYNFTERFIGINAGTKPPGNNPHTVLEAVRKLGLVPESLLPFDQDLLNSVEEYYSFKGGDQNLCQADGYKFITDYEIQHEWVIPPTQETIASQLKFSPIALSVTAWYEQDGLYVDNGQPNSHWVLCFKAEKVPEGYILHVFDSYEPKIKRLDPKHKIMFAKRISILNKKKVIESLEELPEIKDYQNGNHYWNLVKKAVQFIIDILTFWK